MPDPDPGDNPVTSGGLASLLAAVASAGATAVSAMETHEQAPPPSEFPCDELRELQGQVQSLLNAITATLIQGGCNEA